MKFEVKSDNARFQTYLANKETGNQILKVIIDNSLSRKMVEFLFRYSKID